MNREKLMDISLDNTGFSDTKITYDKNFEQIFFPFSFAGTLQKKTYHFHEFELDNALIKCCRVYLNN